MVSRGPDIYTVYFHLISMPFWATVQFVCVYGVEKRVTGQVKTEDDQRHEVTISGNENILFLGEMKSSSGFNMFLFLSLTFALFSLGSGQIMQAVFNDYYDSSATTQCLAEPGSPMYGGGVILNPEFIHGSSGWTVFGHGAIEVRTSYTNNRFMVAHNRKRPSDSFSQKVQLEKGMFYAFSAWVQVSQGSEAVAVVFGTRDGEFVRGGSVVAEQGCWSLLKGGIAANSSSPVDVLFESKNTSTEIWVDNIALQPFSKKQWRNYQDESIEKVRKSMVRFQITYANKRGLGVGGANVLIKQIKPGFPFGCGMNFHILESADYQNWFASRFRYTTFTNAMKWYSTEEKQGQENYTIADSMVRFAQGNDISIRGHNVFWDNQKYQPDWVKTLSPDDLRKAAEKRINSVVSRYAGELIAWDVVNENLHFSFFEDNLGENASSMYYSMAYELDPTPRMFLNEYNTIEYSGDEKASPGNYKKRLEEIFSYPGNEDILAGIGVQGHFGSGQPNLAYMRSSLDILATTGVPIWLTEVSVEPGANQAQYLEEVLREAYSHPAVEGIIMFAGPAYAGFNTPALTDMNFDNTPAGDVVDELIEEWKSEDLRDRADDGGFFSTSLLHGEYEITITDPITNCSSTSRFEVTKDSFKIITIFTYNKIVSYKLP
ncbi:endo-1,4-beta-xylanase 5-like isoform X2 [Syzygium oleosum]|uniref:endo-1,4-beta-xylanase 5-like isoform X2 n=2 Tax=Syzygium oleosum TaxID=219896 RepID=UPI0024B8F227|nr:endo-1,4-beta-xylanase 5-like isoform X2 [Syzygium oleosum]